MKLSLFNTLTRKREFFKPLNPNLVTMYVCGPTVYDHPHIGNARSAVIYDVLYRLLVQLYGKENVLYVRNITDIDDKIIDRAAKLNIPIDKLTKQTIADFNTDMEYLGCLKPNKEPKATEHVADMINIIQKLLDYKIAYQTNGHVYFDVSKANNYTSLSGRTIDELLEAVRIDSDPHKRNMADFVLWKPSGETDDDSAKFPSPFGVGRPGWHIECSAMSNAFLGPNFDIHGGGIDLIFPHHTNEIAQSCSAFPKSTYAKYWVHNGFLTVQGEKMSKSLGNFITVKDLIDGKIRGDIIRLLLLNTHYRKPLDYNDKALKDAEKTLNYWYRAVQCLNTENENEDNNWQIEFPNEFLDALLADLNISMAIKVINDLAKEVHSTDSIEVKTSAAKKILNCAKFLGIMRLNDQEWFKWKTIGDVSITGNKMDEDYIEHLIAKRLAAKKEKNWQLADQIRAELHKNGIIIEDVSNGQTIWRTSSSD